MRSPNTRTSSFSAIRANQTELLMSAFRLFVVFLLLLGALPAHAFDRPFPPVAQRGTMTPASYPVMILNNEKRTLSAGARIWNQHNLIEMPSTLHGENLVVNFTQNAQGEIDRVWILTAAEAAKPAPGRRP
jgi:hypothetical protein